MGRFVETQSTFAPSKSGERAALPLRLPPSRWPDAHRRQPRENDRRSQPNGEGQCAEQPHYPEPSLSVGGAADHGNRRRNGDDYSHPAALFRLTSAIEKQGLFDNLGPGHSA
jgi:catalase